ncbi:Clp protease ClpP [Pediococcus ethanolidurans]|uniref:head maturation protease, ClpP-related n=1 Tax=Pediococcus ethanolidurans TaxID=319653 RepID=UPI0021E7DFB0|nr:head maturation protease, ClpP-related [Pediococcus ethanolidurans]MCV3327602.1 Clp protease ClpP [Pediococcus ethanolidurans]
MTKKIEVKGQVVDDMTGEFFNMFDLASTYPKMINDILNKGDDDEDVEVDVASPGGDVFAASEIYTALMSYQGSITVNVQGLAASAASVIAMAGDKVRMSPTAQMMIHKAWTNVQGNSDDLAHASDMMNKTDQSISSAYQHKTGKSQDELLDLMKNETWITAQDAVDQGFADEIMFDDSKELQVANSIFPLPNKEKIKQAMAVLQKNNTKKKPVTNDDLRQKKLAILLQK